MNTLYLNPLYLFLELHLIYVDHDFPFMMLMSGLLLK